MSKTRTNLAVTALCLGLLTVAALASPVAAQDDEDRSGSDHREEARKQREHRQENRSASIEAFKENRSAERQDRQDRMRAAHDAWEACKHDENATGNESVQDRCGDEKSFFLNATKARREAHALLGAIAALERRIGRLEAREIALEQELAAGNHSANETAELQEKIEKIDSHQERMAERLADLRERLEARHEKWQSVREAVADHRHGDDDEDDDESDDGSESES